MTVHNHADDGDDALEMGVIATGNANASLLFANLSGDDYQIPLILLIVGLSLILFGMTLNMLLPDRIQNLFSCICNQDNENFNYIDAALYKTRHSMYRREVYCQQMKRSNPSSTPSDTVSPTDKTLDGNVSTTPAVRDPSSGQKLVGILLPCAVAKPSATPHLEVEATLVDTLQTSFDTGYENVFEELGEDQSARITYSVSDSALSRYNATKSISLTTLEPLPPKPNVTSSPTSNAVEAPFVAKKNPRPLLRKQTWFVASVLESSSKNSQDSDYGAYDESKFTDDSASKALPKKFDDENPTAVLIDIQTTQID